MAGFVGRVTADKGIQELLDSWARFIADKPNSVLVVAGLREPDSLAPPLSRIIAEARNVMWLGHIDNPSVLYSAIDVLVLPSRREGLPAVVLEASAHAVPVIASNRPGVGEAVRDGVTGFVVDCEHPEPLTRALNTLYADQALARKLGEAGRAHVADMYARTEVHQEWGRYLREQANLSRRRRRRWPSLAR